MSLALTAAAVAGDNMDLRPGSDGPGIIAFVIVAALVLVCVLLYRSMRKQLGRIDVDRTQRDADADPRGTAEGTGPG